MIARSLRAVVAACVLVAGPMGAQNPPPAQSVATEPRSVTGTLFRGTRKTQLPLPDHWVTLHRVDIRTGGRAGSGAVDSMRTGPDGRFAFRYAGVVNDSVLYFVLTSYGGIAYPSPLREPHVSGPDAEITVFDTTSGPVPIAVRGVHLLVTAPREGSNRTVLQVFELSNDSTVTIIPRVTGRDSQPVWSAPLPEGATDVRVNPEGLEGTVSPRGDMVRILAAISPGLRQISFTYTLPADRFPLRVPMQHATEVIEVLIQEPTASVTGFGVLEGAAQEVQGQLFRRFQGQNIPADSVIEITVPAPGELTSGNVIHILAAVLGGLMLLAIAVAMSRRAPVGPPLAVDPVDALLGQLATLDARFERDGSPSDQDRADHERRREAVKQELVRVLGTRAQ